MENLFIVRLSNDQLEKTSGKLAKEMLRNSLMDDLIARVNAFEDYVDIIEAGRRALTVEVRELAILLQMLDKVADIAVIDEYEGLKITQAQDIAHGAKRFR